MVEYDLEDDKKLQFKQPSGSGKIVRQGDKAVLEYPMKFKGHGVSGEIDIGIHLKIGKRDLDGKAVWEISLGTNDVANVSNYECDAPSLALHRSRRDCEEYLEYLKHELAENIVTHN